MKTLKQAIHWHWEILKEQSVEVSLSVGRNKEYSSIYIYAFISV